MGFFSTGEQERESCGYVSDPAGLFLSTTLRLNPFLGIPILEDTVFDSTTSIYMFFLVNSANSIDQTHIRLKHLEDVKQDIQSFIPSILMEIQKGTSILSTQYSASISTLTEALEEYGIFVGNAIFNRTSFPLQNVDSFGSGLWDKQIGLENLVQELRDQIEHANENVTKYLDAVLRNRTASIRSKVDKTIRYLLSDVEDLVSGENGLGLKFTCSLTIFGLGFNAVDIEFVSSDGDLFACSRFEKIKDYFKGERANRFLLRWITKSSLGQFMKIDTKTTYGDVGVPLSYRKGYGAGMALSKESDKAALQVNAFVSMLGIKITADLFIREGELNFYLEGNVWDIFLAQIDVSAEIGNKDWHQLTFNLRGLFVAKARKRRQTQTNSVSFRSSYLDALKKAITFIADTVSQRLTQAQESLTAAQNGLTSAQRWLEDKKADIRRAHKNFDDAVDELESKKRHLENAKEPMRRAMEQLDDARRDVDKLCKIRSCRTICIPGLRCKMCGGWISYPCCDFTSCMISFPDPLCVVQNLLCKGVRLLAFAALEAAKLVFKGAMAVVDAAKMAVGVAQYVVDKSRVVVHLAERVVDVAIFGLEGAKSILERAKIALEAVKFAIGTAVHVFELVLDYGVKSIVDVRNCGFNVELGLADLRVFDVFCDVNAFQLGWKTIRIRINFRDWVQSIWNAAKATIDTLMKELGGIFGRKRREISYDIFAETHKIIRKIRDTGSDNATSAFNTSDQINVIPDTMGFDSSDNVNPDSEYQNRVRLFEAKCNIMERNIAFLDISLGILHNISQTAKTASIDKLSMIREQLTAYSVSIVTDNVTLESANINVTYAASYNLTEDDVNRSMKESMEEAKNNDFLSEITDMGNVTLGIVEQEMENIENSGIADSWILPLENLTRDHFNETECASFRDCILYSLSALYEVHEGETHSNMTEIKYILTSIEDNIFEIVTNASLSINGIFNKTSEIETNLLQLKEYNIFCFGPPKFLKPLNNVTTRIGGSATFYCYVSSELAPTYQWLRNDEEIPDQYSNTLFVSNVTKEDAVCYKCVAGNVVVNITSNEACIKTVAFNGKITNKQTFI